MAPSPGIPEPQASDDTTKPVLDVIQQLLVTVVLVLPIRVATQEAALGATATNVEPANVVRELFVFVAIAADAYG